MRRSGVICSPYMRTLPTRGSKRINFNLQPASVYFLILFRVARHGLLAFRIPSEIAHPIFRLVPLYVLVFCPLLHILACCMGVFVTHFRLLFGWGGSKLVVYIILFLVDVGVNTCAQLTNRRFLCVTGSYIWSLCIISSGFANAIPVSPDNIISSSFMLLICVGV